MMKKLLFLIMLIGFVTAVESQTIAKWKIEDVVKSYSANNDTTYVVNFWATFCKPCNEEIPDFIKLVEKYKGQKVKLLLVSLDLPSYVPVKLPAFIKKNNYNTNHVWLNETDADRFCPAIDEKWSGAIPSTIIVNNKNGYRKFVEDQMNAAEFEASLKEAIGGAIFNFTAPMNDAAINDDRTQRSASYVSKDYVSFVSKDSSVYSVEGGMVTAVARIENFKVVIINAGNLFYTYSNLGSTTLKNGDIVKKDQFIGFATLDLDGNGPILELYLNDSEKNILLSKENFTVRKDKRAKDHSIDRFELPH